MGHFQVILKLQFTHVKNDHYPIHVGPDIYWQTLKTQHLDSCFILCLEKEGKTIILIVF